MCGQSSTFFPRRATLATSVNNRCPETLVRLVVGYCWLSVLEALSSEDNMAAETNISCAEERVEAFSRQSSALLLLASQSVSQSC